MNRSRTRLLIASIGFAAAAMVSSGTLARNGGGSDYGDSYLNDAQKNPRFIEPYADYNPARYRVYYPSEGYYLRQRAARGYDDRAYYGRVEVRPYGY